MKRRRHPLDHLFRRMPAALETDPPELPSAQRQAEPKPTRAKRPWVASKAAWARAEANRIRAARDAILAKHVPQADQRRVSHKMASIGYLNAEIDKFERLATRFAEEEARAAGLPAPIDQLTAQLVSPF